jgi:hypothetical protein
MGITHSATRTQYDTTEDKPNSEIFQTCTMYDVFFIPPLLLKLRFITYSIQKDWFVVYTYSARLESSWKTYKKKIAYFCKRSERNHHSIINSAYLTSLHKQKMSFMSVHVLGSFKQILVVTLGKERCNWKPADKKDEKKNITHLRITKEF